MDTVDTPGSVHRRIHVHIISMHTCPLAQPGTGDAGGMNVYIDRSLRSLIRLFPNLSVEVFTLAHTPGPHRTERIDQRTLLHHVKVPEATKATKDELVHHVRAFARGIRQLARQRPDIIHSHYWLSALAALDYADGAPVVHTMHTTAAAKQARAGTGEKPEPYIRYESEQFIVNSVSELVVNTDIEREQMIRLYGAAPQRISVIPPGVATEFFYRDPAYGPANAGSSQRGRVVFAGRLQPLKGPQLLVEALAMLPADLEVSLHIYGSSTDSFDAHLAARAEELGVASQVTVHSPVAPAALAEEFRRADIVACPSSSETFGLVALEAQACGTAVLASAADGLKAAVEDSVSGMLVSSRTPAAWAGALEQLVRAPDLRARLGDNGAREATRRGWSRTARALWNLYTTQEGAQR